MSERWSKFVCRIRGHRFDGWSNVPRESDGSLGWARCGRCGRVL